MNNCERCTDKLCASNVPIFSTLSTEELIEIISMTGHEKVNKGQNICFEGMKATTLYIINQGEIKLFKYTKDGKEQILHILSEGDFFGELNLLRAGKYNFNAQAITPTKLCTLTKEKIKELILEKPKIGLKILETVGERLTKLETLAQNLATNKVEVRIAHLLLKLKEDYGIKTDKGIEIKIPITRKEMSNYTGVTRETISRKLSKFQDEGIINLVGNKKILVLDEKRLEKYI